MRGMAERLHPVEDHKTFVITSYPNAFAILVGDTWQVWSGDAAELLIAAAEGSEDVAWQAAAKLIKDNQVAAVNASYQEVHRCAKAIEYEAQRIMHAAEMRRPQDVMHHFNKLQDFYTLLANERVMLVAYE
jgi:hypothetical protein